MLFRSRRTYIALALAAASISIFTRRTFGALGNRYQSKLAAIPAQQEWLDITLRGIGDAVIACNPDGTVVFMNGVAEALTGWIESEARSHTLSEVFHIVNEDTRAAVENPVDKALRSGTIVGLANHTVLLRKDGSETTIENSGTPIRDSHGQISGVVLVFRDISGRHARDLALRQSEAESRARADELEAILQVMPAFTFIAHDRKCEDVTSSRLAYEFLRLQPDARTSRLAPANGRQQTFRTMKNGRELAAEELPLQMAAATGRSIRDIELTVAFDDGTSRDILGNATPLLDESGTVRGAIATYIDITDRKRAERILRRTEKLAVFGRLAACLSHEINNPLEAVTSALFLVQRASSLEQVRAYATIAQEELARVSTIAAQTLRFYRQSSHPTVVKIPKLLDSALSLYEQRFLAAGISVECQYEGSASLYADYGELRQAFVNLIGNAFDATHNAGTTLIVRERQSLDWKTGSKGIRVTIADTGSGMDQATLKRSFEPFFSTKGETGSGLGLWITKEIIEKHHGSVRVRSSQAPEKHGTVFSIFLPFEAAEVDAPQNHESSTA